MELAPIQRKEFCKECGNITHISKRIGLREIGYQSTIMILVAMCLVLTLAIVSSLRW